MTPDMIGAAASSHNQDWSTITNTPAIMTSGDYSSKTIEELLSKIQNTYPKMGSVMLMNDNHVDNTWWNFVYIPHRTGVSGDNMNYGTLLLFPMTGNNWSYIIRSSSNKTVSSIEKIYGSNHKPSKSDIGLGNVDNTADSAKSVKYAASAGTAATLSNPEIVVSSTQPSNSNCKLWIKV